MNHYCVVLLTVCAIVASTSAAATTTVAESGGNGGNGVSSIPGNVRALVKQIICAIEAFIKLMQSFGEFGGGIGLVFINPWVAAMRAAIQFIQERVLSIPFLRF